MIKLREVLLKDLIIHALVCPVLLAAVWVLLVLFAFPNITAVWLLVLVIIGAVLISYILLHKSAIGCVLCYKAFAPKSIRSRCRFEPTCSTYMIMAINKYGLFVGVVKGIRRIRRCKPPNGGIDYP